MPVAFREELDPLRPYVPPKSWRMAAEGTDDSYAKLTSNELAFGPLPEAEAALSEVLLNVLQLLPFPGEVVYGWPSFSLYPSVCAVLGMTAELAPHPVDTPFQ